jgi:hypothetical protein
LGILAPPFTVGEDVGILDAAAWFGHHLSDGVAPGLVGGAVAKCEAGRISNTPTSCPSRACSSTTTNGACTPTYEDWLEDVRSKLRQAPHEPISRYRHNLTGEACPEAPPERVEGRSRRNNGDAHLKRQVMGREVVVAITDGRFDFGPWE